MSSYAQLDEAGEAQPYHASTDIRRVSPEKIAKSARYPRVAVLLGVNQHYHVPLLICRSLSTIFALIWAAQACLSIYRSVEVKATPFRELSTAQDVLTKRLHVTQVVLSFLWASFPAAVNGRLATKPPANTFKAAEAAYLSHLFASSLMSRWLMHYSPAAVLVRLCSLSIFLAFGCTKMFHFTGALSPRIESLSRCLPTWVLTCVGLLLSYFTTQQDISIEKDRDDRRRRLLLRMKCLYTMAASSLISLLVIISIIHIESKTMSDIWHRSLTELQKTYQGLSAVISHVTTKDEV